MNKHFYNTHVIVLILLTISFSIPIYFVSSPVSAEAKIQTQYSKLAITGPHPFINQSSIRTHIGFLFIEVDNLSINQFYIIFCNVANISFNAFTYNYFVQFPVQDLNNSKAIIQLFGYNSTAHEKTIQYDSVVYTIQDSTNTNTYSTKDIFISFTVIIILIGIGLLFRKYFL